MASSLSYHQTFPRGDADEQQPAKEEFKSPPIRTWKKFPPSTVDRIAYFPDSASTPYQPSHRIDSLGISPLHRIRRNPCALSPIDRLKLGVKRRGREICKSFELNQTCPTSKTAAATLRPPAESLGKGPRPHDDQDVAAARQAFTSGRDTDVSLSSIYSSSPSYWSDLAGSSASKSQREWTRQRATMEKIRVDGANGLRFSARRSKGCFVSSGAGSPYSSVANNQSAGHAAPSSHTNTTTSESMVRFSKAEMNPNKAVFTIHSKTSRILIVNKNACDLLGYSSKELCEIEFSDLLVNKTKGHVTALAEGQLNSEDGTLVLLSGKVVEMIAKSGSTLAVSLWIRQIDSDGRCLAVAEPVERRIARLLIGDNGLVSSADYESLLLFQMDSIEEFTGLDITTLIPAIKLPDPDPDPRSSPLPKSVHKQKATGRTKDGLSFPLCLIVDRCTGQMRADITHADRCCPEGDAQPRDAAEEAPARLSVTVCVFNNLSGLMVIDETGVIETCNHHFSMLMFGYAQAKIIGQHVSKVIPNFGQELADLSRSRNATLSSLENGESETETDHVERTDLTASDRLSSCADNAKLCLDFSTSKVNSSMVSELSDDLSNIKSLSSDTRSSVPPVAHASFGGEDEERAGVLTSLAKSVSDNILCSENHENNRNLGNVAGAKRAPMSFHSKALGADSVCDNTFEEDYSQLMDNEILTPVNETECFVGGEVSAAQQQQQQSSLAPAASSANGAPRNASGSRSFNAHSPVVAESVINELPNTASSSSSKSKPSKVGVPVDGELRGSSSSSGGSQALAQQRKSLLVHIVDGRYKGEAVHSDGNVIDIIYTVSGHTLPSGRVHCVWVSRDPDMNGGEKTADDELAGDGEMNEDGEEGEEEGNQNLTLTFDSVNSTVENSLGQAIKATAQNTATTTTNTSTGNAGVQGNAKGAGGGGGGGGAAGNAVPTNSSRPNSMSLLSQCEDELIAGEFSRHYSTLKQIGKGAYGYVKMAYRNADRLLVIAKFILKEKLCPQFMVLTEEKREVPMEIYLLTTVEHPNIVNVLDVFENERFYQLVMEKHGCGMDLFEFIDRLPMMDEKLACYIFRQIANAVDYLHSLHILHRDLKDENIIIDQNFHVKLIDFGSATFLEPGKLFSTFYGTTEYCSPEVLAGNKYAGPELEMWSLGVTLYVIMFFENPFVDIEETLHAALVIPQKVSGQLERLLISMLDKNPLTRCTMRDLIADPWLQQEINPALFNFAWVVPCEVFESNPEKYYHGQVMSSGTAISTTSPQNSLSLVDGDSMLDVEGEDGEEIEDEEIFEEDEEYTGLRDSSIVVDQESVSAIAPPSVIKVIEPKSASMGTRKRRVAKSLCHSSIASGCSFGVDSDVCAESEREAREPRLSTGGGKRKGKNKSSRKKRSSKRAAQRRACQLNVSPAGGGLSQSKSENDLFEKSSKLAVDGGSSRLFAGYEGVVTSMRNLQFESVVDQSAMNDFSKTQILNTIALSREEVIVDVEEDPGTGDVREGHQSRIAEEIGVNERVRQEEAQRSPVRRDVSSNSVWSATVNLTPRANNRSNFQILSISYTGGGNDEEADGDDDEGEEGDHDDEDDDDDDEPYENDSWDDDDDGEEEPLERDKRS